jgi:hypothetical protein
MLPPPPPHQVQIIASVHGRTLASIVCDQVSLDVATSAGGDNGIAKLWNRRGISVSSCYDQSRVTRSGVSSWAESPAVSCSRTPRPSSERTARKPSRSAEGEGIASRDGPLPLRPLRPLRCHLREPPFHVAIELRGFNDWIVHPNIGSGAEATEPSCHRPPQCSWWLPTQACAPSSTLRWIHAAWRVRTHTHLCASSAAVDGFLDGRSVPAWRHMRTFVPNRGGQAAGGHYELAVLPVVACSPVVRHPPPPPAPATGRHLPW